MAAVQSNTPHGAQTQVQQVVSNFTTTAPRQAVLHLRGATTETEEIELGEGSDPRTRRRIQWAEDVVDNEGLGRKKSKGWLFL
jgi:protein phosphatase 1 regulatory subunit 11